MGDGWETARRRVPGNDWVILALGHPGVVEAVEIDTAHFKGNYPDGVSIQAASVDNNDPAAIELDSVPWQELLPRQKLSMDAEHRFDDELLDIGQVSHLRMSIYPDGGISRLRVIGMLSR
jgi:allantoicase